TRRRKCTACCSWSTGWSNGNDERGGTERVSTNSKPVSAWADTRVLVTGGASFIGSHLVDRLVATGAKVRVADDLSSGRLENLASSIERVEFRLGDLRDREFAREAVADQQVV